jgi:hypothetical protein
MANIVEIILKAVDNASPVIKKLGLSMEDMGRQMQKVGMGMSLAVTTPLMLLGKSSVDAARDLNESLNKVNVVFKDNSKVIQEWSENSAQAFGLSKQKALEAAGTYGNLFSAMGLGADETAKMSTELVQLAADLASFNNIDVEDALHKLRSGLVGEVEPLRTLGVNFNQAMVEAKAFEMGLADVNGELTTADLVMARYALILEFTKNAQGDFANTSDGLANSQRILSATFENTKAKLGEVMLPMVLQVTQNLVKLAEGFNNMSPGVQKAAVSFGMLLAATGPLLSIFGTLLTVINGLSTALGTGGALAGAAGAAKTALAGLGGIIGGLSLPILALIAAIGALIFVIIKFGAQAKDTFMMIATIINSAMQYIQSQVVRALAVFVLEFSKAIAKVRGLGWRELGSAIISGITSGLRAAASVLVGAMINIAKQAVTAAKAILGMKSPSKVFEVIGQQMMYGMASGVTKGTILPMNALGNSIPQLVGASAGLTINMNNSLNSNVDIEMLAYRVAAVIQRKTRR